MSTDVEAIAKRLVELEDQVRGLSNTSQLSYSSIEDGAILEYDLEGNLVQQIGKQFDGTHAISAFRGPVPPTPTPPLLTAVAGGLTIKWDGLFEAGAVSPMDFSRVAVHVHTSAFNPITESHLLATIETPAGATVSASLTAAPQFVSFVAVSKAGVFSLASTQVSATPSALVDEGAITTALNSYKWIKWSDVDPVPGTDVGAAVGVMWWKRNVTGDVIAQWEWDGDSWEPRTVSGIMISVDSIAAIHLQANSVDTHNLKADSVKTAQLEALSVKAGKIDVNAITATEIDVAALDGWILTGATMQTSYADSGMDRVIIDSLGIRLIPAGASAPTTNFPTDPDQMSSFSGQVTAQGLTVEGNMSVRGLTNLYAVGSVTTLSKEITNSGLAPSVGLSWDVTNFGDYLQEYRQAGTYDGAEYHIGYDFFGHQVISHNTNGSEGTVNMPLGANDSGVMVGGMTKMPGGDYYVLGSKPDNKTYVKRYNATTGAFVGEQLFWNSIPTYPIIGNDGTNLLVAFTDNSTFRLNIYKISPTALTVIGSPMVAQWASSASMASSGLQSTKFSSLMYGNFDFGAPRYVIGTRQANGKVFTMSVSGLSLTVQTNETFNLPAEPMSAVFWDGTRFHSMSSTLPHIVDHSTITWTTQSSKWWASSSYYQTVNGFETTQGPRVSLTMWKRCNLIVTAPAIPNNGFPDTDPDSAKLFLGRGVTDPGIALMFNNKGIPSVGQRTVTWKTDPFTGTSHPIAPNTFPSSAPAILQSAAEAAAGIPMWSLKGDGTVDIGRDEIVGRQQAAAKGQFRAIGTDYGFIIRNDGANTFFLHTAQYDPLGTWNANRPFTINDATGQVTMGLAPIVGTSQQPKFHRTNHASVTTAANGTVAVNHGCPFTPSAVIITMTQANSYFGVPWGSSSFTATVANLRFMNGSAGGTLVSLATGAFTALYID